MTEQREQTDIQTDRCAYTDEMEQTNAHAKCVTGDYKLTCWISSAPTTLLLPEMPKYRLRNRS